MTEVTRAAMRSGDAGAILKAFEVRTAALIISPSLAESPIVTDLTAGLTAESIKVVEANVRPEGGDVFGLVSVGGGSLIRAARERVGTTGERHVAIPTTLSCVEQFSEPRAPGPGVVIFDPRGIRTLPRPMLVAQAFNAMTFAIEAMCGAALAESEETRALSAVAALRAGVLGTIENSTLDDAAALTLLRAAASAGITANADDPARGPFTGLARLTGEALSVRCAVPYATCVALMLPFALAFSRRDCADRIAHLANAFEIPTAGDSVETADAVIAAIRKLSQAAGLPSNFRKAGISRAAMEGAARAVPASPAAKNFVRPVTNEAQMMNEAFRFAW